SRDYPDLRFDILYTDKTVDPIEEQLDFALRGLFPISSELITYPLWSYKYFLCASAEYIDWMGCPRVPEDLYEHSIVVNGAPRSVSTWYFTSSTGNHRITLRPPHT